MVCLDLSRGEVWHWDAWVVCLGEDRSVALGDGWVCLGEAIDVDLGVVLIFFDM